MFAATENGSMLPCACRSSGTSAIPAAPAASVTVPELGRIDAEQHLREFGTPRAHQAVEPDYLSAAQRKGNVFELTGAAQVFDAQEFGAGLGLALWETADSTGRPTMRRMSSSLVTSLTCPALTDTPSRNTA